VALLLAALGFAGGFFIVPVSALIQHIPAEEHKGGVLGAANWLSFVGVGWRPAHITRSLTGAFEPRRDFSLVRRSDGGGDRLHPVISCRIH